MSVTASTRRERIRHEDGTWTDLPGGLPATGLSAIASCAAGVQSLTGAARAAVYHDAMIPHAEVTIGVESLADLPPGMATIASYTPDGGYTLTMSPPGVTGSVDPGGRRDNPEFGPFVLDVGTLNDDRFELGPAALPLDAAANTALPYVWRPAAPLARLVASPLAEPTDPAWSTTAVPSDENLVRNPSWTVDTAYTTVFGGTLTRVASGGVDAGPFARATKTGASGSLELIPDTAAFLHPGDRLSARVAVKGTAGVVARLSVTVFGWDSGSYVLPVSTVTLTGSWQTLTIDGGTVPAGVDDARVSVRVATVGSVPAGTELDVDQAKARRAATAGSYVDGTSASGAWFGPPHESPSYVQTSPGAYSRPTDITAPSLDTDLPDWLYVHRRTGALAVGERLSAPAGRSRYALQRGRVFTVAGWVACVLPSAGMPPVLRWVVDILHSDEAGLTGQTLMTLRSDPFSAAAGGEWARSTATLVVPQDIAANQPRTQSMRVHLEVVDPRNGTGAATTLSTRGVQMYAGPDRGDREGLMAVPLLVRLVSLVNIDAAYAYTVNRVDVHGVDRAASPTAVGVRVLSLDPEVQSYYSAESPGRLTARGPAVTETDEVWVVVEECNGGPGTPDVAIMNVEVWHELDATADVESLTVDRAADADPSSSTIPIGNYAATALTLTLDDPAGEYALWGRSYIDLGHRVDAATGVVYTNRSNDPQGVDAAASGATGTATWPPTVTGAPVRETTADVFGQVPPASFCGFATGVAAYDAPLVTTAPVGEGWTVRARVWVRWSTPLPPTLSFGGAFETKTLTGWSVGMAAGAPVVVPAGSAGVWWLVDLGEVTIPYGSNVAAITAGTTTADDGVVELAAPSFERYVAGEVVEVVETAPAGVYYTTGWDANAPRTAAVTVQAVDILAAAGDGDFPQTIVRDTTVESQLATTARRYLDLGDDQVVIAPQVTNLPYAFPVEKVSTQLADLAKAGVLTAFTDGLGRLVAIPRVDVAPAPQVQAVDDRTLTAASAAVTPDIVRNDVRVTVHPVSRAAVSTVIGYAGRDVLPVLPAQWIPTDQDIRVPAGQTVEVLIDHDPADLESWTFVAVDGFVAPGATVSAWQTTSTPNLEVTIDTYPTFARLRAKAHVTSPYPAHIVRVAGTGLALTVANTTQRYVRDDSVRAFGRRPVEVDVRLAQSAALASPVGQDVLDNYSLRDESGERWLPDLTVETLGDPWAMIGDRALVRDAASGLTGEFRVVSHRYDYGVGASSSYYLRRVATGLLWFVLDASPLDDGQVLS